MTRINRKLARWIARRAPVIRRIVPHTGAERVPVDHVVILDGTNSTLVPGYETNAGILYKLMRETSPRVDMNLHYEGGIAWTSWRSTLAVITGDGINGQIRRAYGAIASRYKPGDRIFLFGFSRGAYAARSLGGIIGMVGLLKSHHATERNVRQVFRHYEYAPSAKVAADFAAAFCQKDVAIESLCVWDTVKSLGVQMPGLSRRNDKRFKFHNHALGGHVKSGFHALALGENRLAYAPILWSNTDSYPGEVEQVWFRGVHGDVGGQLGGFNEARTLSNIPLVWLVGKAQNRGLRLPPDWVRRFELRPTAPSIGRYRGWAKTFIQRHRRVVGVDPSERLHPSVLVAAEADLVSAPDIPVANDEV